jgi:plastocyanin
MKLPLASVLALGVAAQAVAGDISGTIKLSGTPPAEVPIPLDQLCGKYYPGTKLTTSHYVVGASQGLGNVVVFLKGITGKSTGASASPLVLDQLKVLYLPHVGTAQTGQKITVKNSDDVMHNVHPIPTNKTGGNKEENKVQMPKAADLNFTFPAEEMFLRFKCDVHPWMFSYISVFDHPYHATTDGDGTFKISGVPAGKYTLAVIHRKANGAQELTKEIEVKDSGVVVDLTLEVK